MSLHNLKAYFPNHLAIHTLCWLSFQHTHTHTPWDILDSWDIFASSPSLAAWKMWTQPHLIFLHGVCPWSFSSLDSHLSWAWEALLSATVQSSILSLASSPWAPPPPWRARLQLQVDTAAGNGHYPQHPHVNQGRTAHMKLTPSIPGGSLNSHHTQELVWELSWGQTKASLSSLEQTACPSNPWTTDRILGTPRRDVSQAQER